MMLLSRLLRLRGGRGRRAVGGGASPRAGSSAAGVRAVVFDWGDTLMRVFPQYDGPMARWPKVRSMPGVHAGLARVPGHLVCCVASGGEDSDGELMGEALARVRIRHYFRHFLTMSELGVRKGEAGFYEAVCRELELRPGQVVMVGDSLDRDIRPAKAVGMRTVWITRLKVSNVPAEADAVIASMKELSRVLARMG